MRISLKVTICFMTAIVSLLSVSGNKEGLARINCDNTPVNQTAHVGGSVTINCNYSRAEESNVRYLCREDEKLNCRNMIETHSSNYTKRGRFSLTDNKQQRVYTVTISGLTKADAGRYKCAMENSSFITCSTEVHLHILNWDDVKSEEISGGTGDTIQIQCYYPISHEIKEKSLCKGKDPSNCEELIHTTEQDRDTTKGRFIMKDNRRVKYYYVYIKNLSINDSGTYWSSFDRTCWYAGYCKFHLSVVEKGTKTKESDPQAPQGTTASVLTDKSSTSSQPETGMMVGVVVSLTLLVIAVVVLILCRHKLPSTQVCCTAGGSSEQRTNTGNNTEGNHGDYEEIEENLGNTLPSIYVNINPPADHLHYANVYFQKDSVSVLTDRNTLPDTNKNVSSCDYSSISPTQGTTRPPAAGQTVYSTVNLEGNMP
ncbi:polymeric immunoglobulin receptor-like isoform X1 [Thunnus albacares]|uniref:polymeric immunoglobulin receptor-like isoform X1 n=1 Tax=Thunnus albacares TaxID=8236 RepID=UPI001CF6B503|nr:polymeric immunoglobulin receptor-like isoform X1 [Thunnus albacares]